MKGEGWSDDEFETVGNDLLGGLAGEDALDGEAGTNQIDGGDGDDSILIDGKVVNGSVRIPATGTDAGAGVETIRFAGLSADNHIAQMMGG